MSIFHRAWDSLPYYLPSILTFAAFDKHEHDLTRGIVLGALNSFVVLILLIQKDEAQRKIK